MFLISRSRDGAEHVSHRRTRKFRYIVAFRALFGTRSQISCLLACTSFYIPHPSSRSCNLTLLLFTTIFLGERVLPLSPLCVSSPAHSLTPGSLVFCPYPLTSHQSLSSSPSLEMLFYWPSLVNCYLLCPFPFLFSCYI